MTNCIWIFSLLGYVVGVFLGAFVSQLVFNRMHYSHARINFTTRHDKAVALCKIRESKIMNATHYWGKLCGAKKIQQARKMIGNDVANKKHIIENTEALNHLLEKEINRCETEQFKKRCALDDVDW